MKIATFKRCKEVVPRVGNYCNKPAVCICIGHGHANPVCQEHLDKWESENDLWIIDVPEDG